MSVPPTSYGGSEWIAHWLCEGLRDRGHDVTLLANADSICDVPTRSVFAEAPSGLGEIAIPDVMQALEAPSAPRRSAGTSSSGSGRCWTTPFATSGRPARAPNDGCCRAPARCSSRSRGTSVRPHGRRGVVVGNAGDRVPARGGSGARGGRLDRFVVDDVEEMADAIGRLGGSDRAGCRRSALDRFDVNRMVDRYEALYRSLASERGPREVRDTA